MNFENIWDNTLNPKIIKGINPMNEPQYYSTLRNDSNIFYIEKFSYETSEKVGILFSSEKYVDIKNINSYKFSKNENKILLICNVESIYRHSYLADYFIYDINTKKIDKIDNSKIQEVTFSPNEKYVCYVKENNIYIYDITTKKISQITNDGKKNKIINGISDWVYEEELALVKAFSWSNNSKKILYLKFNETNVKSISMDIFGDDKYPSYLKFKYPKSGEKNSEVSVHIFNVESKKIENLNFDTSEELYFPRIYPYKDNYFAIMTLNRKQNDLKIISLEESKKVLYSEKNSTYIEVPFVNFIEDDFIISSEKDGFCHLYHYKYGKELKQITKGNWEVLNYYGYDKNLGEVYFKSNITGRQNQVINSINIKENNEVKYISSKKGINNIYFNSNYKYCIKIYSDDNTPPLYTLENLEDKSILKILENNKELSEKILSLNLPKKEFKNLKIDNSVEVDTYLLKPTNFDKNKKYPLLIHVYGGPGSRLVYDNWSTDMMLYFKYLCNKGYLILVTETRGTGGRGADYKKISQFNLGNYETIDLINIAKKMSENDYIDKKRIGILGWSYGGYMSSLAITKGADIFSLSVAVAPVVDWKYYNTIYTERYLGTPEENPKGYKENSPLNFVEKLKGKYLLIHGSADDNVHHHNSMIMAKKLIDLDKNFDFFIYPNKDHSIKGGKTRTHLFKKITNFVENNL